MVSVKAAANVGPRFSTPDVSRPARRGGAGADLRAAQWRSFVGPESTSKTRALDAGAPLSFDLVRGTLRVRTAHGALIDHLAPRISFQDQSIGCAFVPLGEPAIEKSERGAFEVSRFKLVPEKSVIESRASGPILDATLEIRRDLASGVLVGKLEYDGPALAAEGGLRFSMSLDGLSEGFAAHQHKLHWLAPRPAKNDRDLEKDNLGLVWRKNGDSDYHLLMPLGGAGLNGVIGAGEDGKPELRYSSHAPDHAPNGEIPLFVLATGSDPFTLPKKAWASALPERLRETRTPPPMFFDHFGYCTWEALHTDLCTEENILKSVAGMREKGIPVKTVIIDDGMQHVTEDRRLASFEADPAKFPKGIAHTAKKLKELGVEDVVVWMAKDGYWRGVDPKSEIGKNHALLAGNDDIHVPDPRNHAGESFYVDYFQFLIDAGVTGVKVDNQSMTQKTFEGKRSTFDSGRGAQEMIAGAAKKTGMAVMDCMSQRQFNLLNTSSAIIRGGDDYIPHKLDWSKGQLLHLFKNSYFLSPLFYLDGDMLQTHDERAVAHTYSRLMLDTLYVSDVEGQSKAEVVLPAVDSAGNRIRLKEPARLTRDGLFVDQLKEKIPMKVLGKVGPNQAMIAAFNVTEGADSVQGVLRHEDADLDPKKPLAIFARGTGKLTRLDPGASRALSLDGNFAAEMFTAAPIEGGAAVLGLLNKYFGPGAVTSESRDGSTLKITLSEAGDFGVYLEKKPKSVKVAGKEVPFSMEGNLLRVPSSSFGCTKSDVQVTIELG
jgi:raffinose synthase